jgi:hypothetical protein
VVPILRPVALPVRATYRPVGGLTKIVFNWNRPSRCISLLKVDEIAQERVRMKGLLMTVRRRDLLRFGTVFAAAATSAVVATNAMTMEPTGSAGKRKARYQANSVEVQTFYRVNRYPDPAK